jgi:hypothetical protein
LGKNNNWIKEEKRTSSLAVAHQKHAPTTGDLGFLGDNLSGKIMALIKKRKLQPSA